MKSKFVVFIVFCFCIATTRAIYFQDVDSERDKFIYGEFPKDFRWGFATSSYQIEGGWDADGKGENIWDEFTHRNNSIVKDGATGDVACDSYNKYEEDVQLLKNIGAKFYRFSISWARILPLGTLEKINQPGIDYYNNLINSLLANGITPMVTMYHWDLPQTLQEAGGWPNEALVGHFENYARVLYTNFGDRVKEWVTINEPHVICHLSYGLGILAPGLAEPANLPYQCAHSLIKAHARAYRIYQSEFKSTQNGRVGISLDAEWEEPLQRQSPSDVEAAERTLQFRHGWIFRPIVSGDYPPLMREIIDKKSNEEGRNTSRLPSFDDYWSNQINGSYDFLGLNHYTTRLVTAAVGDQKPGYASDTGAVRVVDPIWPSSSTSDWIKSVPWGLRRLLNWIKNSYGNTEVLITENGWSDDDKTGLDDDDRAEYYRNYINEVLKAVTLDGCNVTAYTAWSLMDNFEWTSGYRARFGVHHVNFSDPTLPRTPKKSAKLLQKIIQDNGFPKPN